MQGGTGKFTRELRNRWIHSETDLGQDSMYHLTFLVPSVARGP